MDDETNITKRITRYARTSATFSNLAIKLARAKYLGHEINRETHSKDLMEALGSLKGPLLKVAQLLATIPNALPKEYAYELQKLQANAPAMGWVFVKRRMKSELGKDWQKQFGFFEKEAISAASLGQVHKARTLDGDDIACKLQYPDMKTAIDSDLSQLKLIFSLFEKYDKAISTEFIYEELKERLNEELDYEQEAKHNKLFKHMLRDEKNVFVADVFEELSTDRLLTTNWLEGSSIMDYMDADQETRNDIALNLFKAWYIPLYYYGIIHGDPHPGNYTIREDLGLNLLDFGCVRVFPPKFIGGVIDLYHALRDEDNEKAIHAYEAWGFKNLNDDVIETLNTWARFLYGPILEDRVRKIGEIDNEVYGKDIAEKVHEELRKAEGMVTIPKEFVFMDRAALGLGSIFLHLKAEVNWHSLFNEMTKDFDINELEKRQKDVLDKFL